MSWQLHNDLLVCGQGKQFYKFRRREKSLVSDEFNLPRGLLLITIRFLAKLRTIPGTFVTIQLMVFFSSIVVFYKGLRSCTLWFFCVIYASNERPGEILPEGILLVGKTVIWGPEFLGQLPAPRGSFSPAVQGEGIEWEHCWRRSNRLQI